MKNYSLLSDSDLLSKTAMAAKNEKSAMLALLDYLIEVDLRKLYATQSYSTLFDYLVRGLLYSESQAADRVNTVRLMRSVPAVKYHLETGELSLTTASQIQRFIRTESKAVQEAKAGKPSEAVSLIQKEKLIERCLNQPKREVEKILFAEHSAPAQAIAQERTTRISECRTELKFTVDENTLLKLKQLQELIGNRSLEKIFDQSVELLLRQEAKKRGALAMITKQSEDRASLTGVFYSAELRAVADDQTTEEQKSFLLN